MSAFLENLGKLLASVLQPVTPFLSLVFVLFLFRRGLRDYWIVAAYFTVATIHGALSHFRNVDSIPSVYVCFTALELLLIGVVAWQLGHRTFVSYPSLGAFATRALWILLPLAVILAFVTILTDPPIEANRHSALQFTLAIQRSIRTVILAFLLAIATFAGWFPVRMKQNSARLLIGFLVLQACEWIALLASNTNSRWTFWGNFWRVIVSAEALVYWLVTMKPSGQVAVASTVPRWDPERMNELTGQLEQLQSQLARRGY
jgi:hypothetical protein